MLRLIGRRLLLMIPTLILASMLIFALAEVLPGDVGRSILGPYATEEQVQLLNEKLGADRPLVVRYVAWAGGFVTGDWGESALLEIPVRPLVLDAFWNSLLLAGFALILIVPTSIALGVFAGSTKRQRPGPDDHRLLAVDDGHSRVRQRGRAPLHLRGVAQVAARHGHCHRTAPPSTNASTT